MLPSFVVTTFWVSTYYGTADLKFLPQVYTSLGSYEEIFDSTNFWKGKKEVPLFPCQTAGNVFLKGVCFSAQGIV